MPGFRPFFNANDRLSLALKAREAKRELAEKPDLLDKKVAVLGGSTTTEIIKALELYLLDCGIRPTFYESDYNKFYEEAVFENPRLDEFDPDVIYLHTTSRNIQEFPSIDNAPESISLLTQNTFKRFSSIWDSLGAKYNCAIIQNNFDPIPYRPMGNLDGVDPRGAEVFIRELNTLFAQAAADRPELFIHDINRLAAETGLEAWHDSTSWHAYKCSPGLKAAPILAHSLAATLRALFGKGSKCLVLDLDNTLWGGVIGDDGVDNIRLGRETSEAEAYLTFQAYIKEVKKRGVLLAVCSKNEHDSALEGLNHPDSLLAPEDFTVIMANWEPKHQNILNIAKTLNIGLDSLVFFDDNPAEREIVQAQLPDVAVIDPGRDVSEYSTALDRSRLFEAVSLSTEDLKRNEYYTENAKRVQAESSFKDYGEYLSSLEMSAEIGSFSPQYFNRITQLTNKTNQFNLTTRRYTLPEIEQAATSQKHISLYGRLSDKFGDNGLISVVLCEIEKEKAVVDLWLMSCRVFKREMELAMFDALVLEAAKRGVSVIVGHYARTAKNGIVADLYPSLGFDLVKNLDSEKSVWQYAIPGDYQLKNTHIKVKHGF